MSKRRGRKVVLFAGVFTAITLAAAGVCWKGFIERYYFYRIWRDPAYILAIIEQPEGTPERRAIRMYFRSRPAVLEKEEEELHGVWSRWPPELDSDIDGFGDQVSIRAQAKSWEALVSLVKPTLTWNGCDLLYVSEGEDGNRIYTLEEACVLRVEGEEPRWVLLDPGEGRWDLSAYRLQEGPLSKSDTHSDVGADAILLSTGPAGESIYEIGWQDASCNQNVGRQLYVLHDARGAWRFVGEGPGYSLDPFSSRGSTAEVEWMGRSEAPVRIRFVEGEGAHDKWGEWEDELVYQDSILEGDLPARLRLLGPKYLLAREGDTVDTIAARLTGDPSLKRLDIPWRVSILELNPGIPEGVLPAGTRLRAPGRGDCSAWEQLLRGSTATHP